MLITTKRTLVHAFLFCAVGLSPAAAQRQLAYRLPGMEQVRRLADQPYRSLRGTPDTVMYGSELRYDVYLPANAASTSRPGVIFIHGGMVPGRQRVSPKDDLPAYREWGRLVAAAGLIGITFSHRQTTEENVDVAAGDVEALVRVVRERAAEWQLDPGRVCIAVFSAGGPLSSLFLQPRTDPVRCIALYYPFLDVEHAAVITPFRSAHTPERMATLQTFSPRQHVLTNSTIPPLLLARAGRDAIPGINASIDRFVQAALWVNAPLDLYVHPTGAHGFDMISQPDERAADIVSATLAFFRRHLER